MASLQSRSRGRGKSLDLFPLWLSLRVAGCATVLSVLLGLLIAYPLARCKVPGRDLLSGLVNLPLVLPPTVLGYALLVALGNRSAFGQGYAKLFGHPLVFSWQGAVVAACVASLPLFAGYARVALSSVDPEVVDAARMDGAGGWQTFRFILLPLSSQGLIAGTTLTFARALGDFGATLMVAGDTPGITQTLPLAVYDALLTGDTRAVRVFVGLSVGICVVVCLLAGRLTRER